MCIYVSLQVPHDISISNLVDGGGGGGRGEGSFVQKKGKYFFQMREKIKERKTTSYQLVPL
jgi:hypothetical protein